MARMISIPADMLKEPALRERDRLHIYAALAGVAADRDGVYFVNGGLCFIPRGACVTTLNALARLVGCTKDQARRHLDALIRAGLVKRCDTATGFPGGADGGIPVAAGSVLYIKGLCDHLVFEDTWHRPLKQTAS